jgi:hypothetical protein
LRVFAFLFLLSFLGAIPSSFGQEQEFVAGPAYSDFQLTLASGHRIEAMGPLFYSQHADPQTAWGIPPIFTYSHESEAGWTEMDLFYPIANYRRFGSEWHLQLMEMLNFDGGQTQDGDKTRQFTLFPIYFQQRSSNPALNYTAFVPFYGHLVNRLFRDDAKFIMLPFYLQTRKRDVVTDNYFFPFFHRRHGDHLTGWQAFPIVGKEHKAPTLRTNNLDEVETVGGYERTFYGWPSYVKAVSGVGTTNVETRLTLIPFYSEMRSPLRDETYYGWPFGYTKIDDLQKGFKERALFWPFFVKIDGTVHERRVFPFYSHAQGTNAENRYYMWPTYVRHHQKSKTFDRVNTRILFFLYTDNVETNTLGGGEVHRADFWPFYAFRRDLSGDRRLQVFAPMEPFFANNRAMAREYSPLWAVWRWEKNGKTGATSQSLLWNLYRREKTGNDKKFSLLFGIIRYQSTAEGRTWRLFWLPMGHKKQPHSAPARS